MTPTLVVINDLCSRLGRFKMLGVVGTLRSTSPTHIKKNPAYLYRNYLAMFQCHFIHVLNTPNKKQQNLLLHLALEQSLQGELARLCQLPPAEHQHQTSNGSSVRGLPAP